jgi:hypothetical protein
MTTQPFLLAPFHYRPALGYQEPTFKGRKINDITDFVGFEVHAVYPIGEFSCQPYSH